MSNFSFFLCTSLSTSYRLIGYIFTFFTLDFMLLWFVGSLKTVTVVSVILS